MPIDFEEMKKRNAQNSKSRKSDNKKIIPLIRPEKSTANEQERKNRIKEKLKEKLGGNNNMVRKEKITKKGSSGLGVSSNTKKDYDYLVSGVNEAQQKVQKESTIGVNQPNNNRELLKMGGALGNNQGNNGGGNNNSLLPSSMKDLLLLKEFISPQQQGGSNTNNMLKIINDNNISARQQQDKQMEMMMKGSDDRLMFMMQQMNQNKGQPQTAPMETFFKGVDFTEKRMGDRYQKNKDELDHDIRKQELTLKERGRQDMLNREERAIIREDKKSERMLGIGEVVLEKVVGSGIGNLINDVMSAGGKKGKRRGREAEPTERFDISLLDEEL